MHISTDVASWLRMDMHLHGLCGSTLEAAGPACFKAYESVLSGCTGLDSIGLPKVHAKVDGVQHGHIQKCQLLVVNDALLQRLHCGRSLGASALTGLWKRD
jgi:hypothetical protein